MSMQIDRKIDASHRQKDKQMLDGETEKEREILDIDRSHRTPKTFNSVTICIAYSQIFIIQAVFLYSALYYPHKIDYFENIALASNTQDLT